MLLPGMATVIILPVLTHMTVAVGIIVEYLVHGVPAALTSSLAVIERCHFERRVAEQCVAQNEEIVHLIIATRGQTATVCLMTAESALHGVHGGGACLDPYEFPVIIKIV